MNRIYFDNAATTPLDKDVIAEMTKAMELHFGNPSSVHAHGREVRAIIENARKSVAHLLNCSPGEIFFTSGGTEADNTAIRKSVDCLGVATIITSPIEHHAVSHTVDELEHHGKIKKHFVKLDDRGRIDFADLEELLKSNTDVLVSLMHANNEIGNLLDIERASDLCKHYNALFHSDTVQTIGHLPIDLQKLNIDFIACAAHKFKGPKGVGFIYINSRNKIDPFITGGAQERNMRAGTENIYGIVGLAKALEISCANMEADKIYISELRTHMMNKLIDAISGIQFNGDVNGESLYTILNVSFPPTPIAEMLLFKLDIEGISVSGGSACASGSNVGSHVLTAIGADPNRPSVRFSFGKQNTKGEVDMVVEKLRGMFGN